MSLFSVDGQGYIIHADLVELRGPDYAQGETLAGTCVNTPDELGEAIARNLRILAPRLIQGAAEDSARDGESYHPTFEVNIVLEPIDEKEDQHE